MNALGILACLLGIVACIGWWRELSRAREFRARYLACHEHDLARIGVFRSALESQNKRRADAELACELLRQSLMRGSAVATWTWPEGTRPTNADAHYLHVKTDRGDIMLTEESFALAHERAAKTLNRHDRPPL